MSVWSTSGAQSSQRLALSTEEGDLVSVAVRVDARHLELLLEALARVEFPINPQIYHEAVTLVEFPAYEGRLGEVRRALRAFGFDPAEISVTRMIDRIHAAT